jgi:hypothetical protein
MATETTVALVGSESLLGREIRDVAAASSAGLALRLIAADKEEPGRLTRLGDEPALVLELDAATLAGARAVLLFVIQIPSAERFSIARDIDPAYAAAFDHARARGVEVLAWRCKVTLDGIEIAAPVPIVGG